MIVINRVREPFKDLLADEAATALGCKDTLVLVKRDVVDPPQISVTSCFVIHYEILMISSSR